MKYRCIRQDGYGGIVGGKDYVEDNVDNARKRACSMIHEDPYTSVYIYTEDYPFGYHHWVGYDRSEGYYLKDERRTQGRYVNPNTGKLSKTPVNVKRRTYEKYRGMYRW